MLERRRNAAIVLGIAAIAIVGIQHPSADLSIQTHQQGDLSPRRVQAAFDIGLASVSVLVTWSARRLR